MNRSRQLIYQAWHESAEHGDHNCMRCMVQVHGAGAWHEGTQVCIVNN